MIFNFFKRKPRYDLNLRPVVLLVLDGYGIAPPSRGNAISLAKKPNMDLYAQIYPNGALVASGEAVGLPANEVGNTEVGHLTLGAGRVIYQDLKRISMSIADGTFFQNDAFIRAYSHTQKHNSNLHIMGLVGSGNVHSSNSHLFALLEFCRNHRVKNVYLHLFTDGRDSPPREATSTINSIQERLDALKIGKIATISGRYYAMDRDRRWDRTEKTYRAIVEGVGQFAKTPLGAITNAYARQETDEFIQPSVIVGADGNPTGTVGDNDAVIFFNFRVDRPRQLTMAFVLPDFEKLSSFEFGYVSDVEKVEGKVSFGQTFKRNLWPQNLFFVTMTEYQKNLPVSAIAFPPVVVKNSLPEVLSDRGLKQLAMAESEKERFVTYYFGGLRETPFPNQDYLIVPSPKVATYDKRPQMSVFDIVKNFKRELARSYYKFFVINFANADMVGHTGNINACVKAIEFMDRAIGEVVNAVLDADGVIFITADHGNAEEMIEYPASSFYFTSSMGATNTDHSNNVVPLIVVGSEFSGGYIKILSGGLSDVATTILAIMNIPKPPEMTGKNLLQ
jgi:2,3-bisphosphoglycerate-independent phosphoglycerate mutase